MNSIQVTVNTLFALVCALLIGTKSFAEPANLGKLKEEITTYHDSGQYHQEFSAVIQKAQVFIDQVAKENASSKKPKKLALVLDIDETSLSNYPMMKAHRYCATMDQFDEAQRKSKQPALSATRELFEDALKHHIAVFFITGRPNELKKFTEENLNNKGFKGWAAVYYRPAHYKKSSVASFKTHTRELIEQKGYTIVASIGDQESDLSGGHAMQTFKLPNPYYYIP
jgi:acid phosphatase